MVAESYAYRFFFWSEGQLLFAERHYHRFDFFLENCSNARNVLLLALSPEFTAVFGTFARYKRP